MEKDDARTLTSIRCKKEIELHTPLPLEIMHFISCELCHLLCLRTLNTRIHSSPLLASYSHIFGPPLADPGGGRVTGMIGYCSPTFFCDFNNFSKEIHCMTYADPNYLHTKLNVNSFHLNLLDAHFLILPETKQLSSINTFKMFI